MLIGILVALPAELATLTSQKLHQGQRVFIQENIVVMYSGTGRENALKAAEQLISDGVKGLISWGCAGALAPDLTAGTLLFPEIILTATGTPLKVSEKWLNHIKKNLPIAHRSILSVESLTLIESTQEKKQLHEKTQALSVDMESAAVVEVAQKAGIECLIIRAISDPVTLSIPSVVSQAINAEGEVVLKKLGFALLKQPQQLPALIKLGIHFSAAKHKLKAVAEHLDTIVCF
jgi:hopanoid-associated phosphorylase